MQSIKVNEIFYSLQGEGSRSGEPSIFIRLSGCSASKACLKSGVICDTYYDPYIEAEIKEIHQEILNLTNDCKWIIWTGGEPLDQLTQEIVDFFNSLGYKQAIETSGIKKPPKNLKYIVLSPKIPEKAIIKLWKDEKPNELRWVRSKGDPIPDTEIKADHYYISPHSDEKKINKENLDWCIKLCKDNPDWKLSIQQHKIWNVR